MSTLLVRLIINALALVAAVQLVPGVRLDYRVNPLALVAVALIFAVVNSYLKPIVRLLSLPISFVTLGLVGIVINVAMLLLTAYVSNELRLPFTIAGWPRGPLDLDVIVAALLASLVISVVSTVLSLVLAPARVLAALAYATRP
ncbi:MAG: phage holin family protein [Chloroflexota bacterium]|nr:phage holin family protein [Chloroflexota bacterium]